MLKDDGPRLRQRLRAVGLDDAAIAAAWPVWWSEAADASLSARAELRYSIARKLGLDPHSLLEDEGEPRFIWRDEARFKRLSGETEPEKWALASFGSALGAILLSGTGDVHSLGSITASDLREMILASQPYVRLLDLLSLCWSIGIPSVHLRVFPHGRKRMAAMSVAVGDRNAILLAKDSTYPAQIAFYLAHELAHIFRGHLREEKVIVDLEGDPDGMPTAGTDPDEAEADAFALELLTGEPAPIVLPSTPDAGPESLATSVLAAAPELRIEPGTLAMCFGYSTGNWATAMASLRHIYESPKPVWREVNRIALTQLALSEIPDDSAAYVRTVLGVEE
jgi:hypothetical protein